MIVSLLLSVIYSFVGYLKRYLIDNNFIRTNYKLIQVQTTQ